MKPFNLEAAKNGAAVQTRSGLKVRHLAFDIKTSKEYYNIGGLIQIAKNHEDWRYWNHKGKYYHDDEEHDFDLVMAPVKIKYYIIVFQYPSGVITCTSPLKENQYNLTKQVNNSKILQEFTFEVDE